MDGARWERIQTQFHEAAKRPAEERAVFLQHAGGDDESLLADVLAMLDEDANLASVEMERNEYTRAEQLCREAVRRFRETQSAAHLNTGIAKIKLGRALLRQSRYQEAEGQTLAGYRILSKRRNRRWPRRDRIRAGHVKMTGNRPA